MDHRAAAGNGRRRDAPKHGPPGARRLTEDGKDPPPIPAPVPRLRRHRDPGPAIPGRASGHVALARPARSLALLAIAWILAAAASVLLGPALAPALAHEPGDPDHGHITVTLDDDPTTPDEDETGRIVFTFRGPRIVEAGQSGATLIQVPFPESASLVSFDAGTGPAGGRTEMGSRDGHARLVHLWDAGGPAAGSVLENVTVVAGREAPREDRASLTVQWHGLDVPRLHVRIEIPADHILSGNAGLFPLTHGTADGRRGYQDVDLDGETLTFTVREAYAGPDPAFAHPPNPLAGFLIVLGIGLVSGGLWFLGKRLEARLADEAADEP